MAGLELPIFELPLVLLPGEQVPLHIFEDRYKRMVGTALEQGEPFGIVLRDDDGARSVGCTARIDDVLERFDDGRMNIVVSGEEPFKVIDRFESPDYPAGEVELIPDQDIPPIDEASATAAREAFAELAERATGERPEPEELDGATAYAIAARIELPAETKSSSSRCGMRTTGWHCLPTLSARSARRWNAPRKPPSGPAATARSTSRDCRSKREGPPQRSTEEPV